MRQIEALAKQLQCHRSQDAGDDREKASVDTLAGLGGSVACDLEPDFCDDCAEGLYVVLALQRCCLRGEFDMDGDWIT
jgi:hypothetical protein